MQNHQTKTVNLTELCDKKLSRIPVAFAQKAPFTYRQDPQYAHFLSPLEHIRYVPGMEHLSYDHPRNPRWGVQPSDAKLNVPQVLRRGHKAAEPSYEPPVSNRPVRPPIRGTFRGKSKEEYMRIVEEDKERRAREAKEGCSSKVDSTSASKQKASVGSSGLLKKRSRPTDTENAAKDVKSAKPAKCRLLSAELLRCRELLQTSFKEDHILLKYVADRLGHTYPNSVRIPVSRPRLDVNVPIPVPPNGPGFGPSRKREPSPSAITTPADPTGPKSGPSRKRVRSSSEVSISAAPGGPKSGSSRKRERSPAPKEENQQRKRAQQKPLSTPAAPVPPPVVAPAPVATSATPAQPAESSVISSGPVSTSTAPVASPAPPKVSPESVATSEAPVAPKAGSVAASTTPEVAATASDSDSPSQLRMYAKMFQRLALAYKRRGDSASTDVERLIDHLHAMCNYILGFFYADRSSNTFNKENWDSFHPFATAVSGQLKNMKEHEDLYAISLRLSSLVRFHAYGCLEAHAKQQLEKVLAAPRDNEEVLKRRLRITESTLKEYEHARALLRESERFLSFDQVSDRFPRTFQQVCLLGNLDAGAVLGGEAGTSTKPMYPWTPHSSLRHASLMAKAAIKEYLAKKSISFKEIRDLEEFFFV